MKPIQTSKKILIIDDDAMVVRSLGKVLLSSGFQVVTATDGIQATAIAVKEKPDLIILDLRMPAGDGHVVGKRLMENLDTCRIPIIMLTGSAHAEDIKKAKEWGARAVLLKPTNPDDLRAAVKEALQATGT